MPNSDGYERTKDNKTKGLSLFIPAVWHQDEKRAEEYIIDIWHKMHSLSHFTPPETLILNYSLTSRLIRWESKMENSWQAKSVNIIRKYTYLDTTYTSTLKRTEKTTEKYGS